MNIPSNLKARDWCYSRGHGSGAPDTKGGGGWDGEET